MTVTALYAAPLALLYLALSANVIRWRRRYRLTLGDGKNRAFARRLRAHGNFAEYTPFGLVLMGLAETGGTAAPLLHVCGALLLAGRALHAYSLAVRDNHMPSRTWGMGFTFTSIALAAALCLAVAVSG